MSMNSLFSEQSVGSEIHICTIKSTCPHHSIGKLFFVVHRADSFQLYGKVCAGNSLLDAFV